MVVCGGGLEVTVFVFVLTMLVFALTMFVFVFCRCCERMCGVSGSGLRVRCVGGV